MTTQLPRERSETEVQREPPHPDVLFEEARRRRRRRWIAAAVFVVVIVAVLTFGMAGGGRGGTGGRTQRQPFGPGSGAGSGHVSASRAFPGAPATGHSYTGRGASCPLAPHSRYLPPWSGCVSTMVADVSGDGRPDLILVYSSLARAATRGLPPRTIGRRRDTARYWASQAMLRIVTPDGHTTTVPITYRTTSPTSASTRVVRAAAAALISVAHVNSEPGKTIFLQTGQISSGSSALAYSFYHGQLVPSRAVLAYGGDAGSQTGFQCLAGNPPQLTQQTYDLIRGIKATGNTIHIHGWWKVTTTRYEWHGPRLMRLEQRTTRRRLTPSDTVGRGCLRGIT